MGRCSSSFGNSAPDNSDQKRPWSDLPALALYAILMRLTSPFGFAWFAAVCRRSVAKSGRSDFMASQPPLLMTFPNPSSRKWAYSLYSLVEHRSYRVESPWPSKFWRPVPPFIEFRYLGHSHGYLIMLSFKVRRGRLLFEEGIVLSLLNPCTGERINFKRLDYEGRDLAGGLLTEPITSADCKLIIFSPMFMHCYRINSEDDCWYKFLTPGGSAFSVAVHKGRLYVSGVMSRVTIMDVNSPHEILGIVDVPATAAPTPYLPCLVRDIGGELLKMFYHVLEGGDCEMEQSHSDERVKPFRRRLERYRLEEIPEAGRGAVRWVRVASASGPLFVDCDGGKACIGSANMMGVNESCVYHASSGKSLYYVHTNAYFCPGELFSSVQGPRVWVHPSSFSAWGFSFC